MNYLNLSSAAASYLHTDFDSGIVTIKMYRPEKLNGWTTQMMDAIKEAFIQAGKDESTKAVILTGEGDYYSAGVNLGGSLKLMHPRKLRDSIVDYNRQLFEAFLRFPKLILVAVNGPAIGASVTSATLCSGIIASEKATFSTPFSALGVTPEGCSSVHFSRLMGEDNAERMLGKEGWKPNAEQALTASLIQWCVPHEKLLSEANKIARNWIAEGKVRSFMAGSQLEELLAVNAQESLVLADAFLGAPFLRGQAKFFWRKKKIIPSLVFWMLCLLRPLWRRFL